MTEEVTSADEVKQAEQEQQGAAEAEAASVAAAPSEQEEHAERDAVREAQFDSLSGEPASDAGPSLELIMDLEVDLCAELGRTAMLVRDLMELHPGSIIELRKVVGEPVDLMANGKLVARGEVVVVDETFGVRVTEIMSRTIR